MKYQIVADERVDFRIVLQLREIGLTVYAIVEQEPSISDEKVLAIANENEALLITEDKDFGELVFRLRLPHRGRMADSSFPTPVVANILDEGGALSNNWAIALAIPFPR
jgi:hypothetical protein